MIPNKHLLETTMAQINNIYKQIKKSEVSPKTEYLFAGLHSNDNANNRQKTMQKIELLNSIDGKK